MLGTIINSLILKKAIVKSPELNTIISDTSNTDSLQNIVYNQLKSIDSLKVVVDSLNKMKTPLIIDETLWGMPVDSAAIIISAIITISIFALGYFLNWLNKKIERKSELESIKSIVTVWVELLKSPVLQQASNSRFFAIALRNSSDIHPVRLSYNMLLADKLQSIELKELIQVFILNTRGEKEEKSKDLFNLISQLDFLVQVEEKIPEAYIVYQNRTFQILENWNFKLNELDLFKSQMTTAIANNPGHRTFALFQHFNTIGNNYIQQFPTGGSVKDSKRYLLDPLTFQISASINQNPNDPIAHELARKVQELNIIYKEWQVHFEGNAKVFYDFAIRLVYVYKILGKSTTRLNERSFKSIWKLN